MKDERNNLPSASGFQRIDLCRGSWRAEKGMPDDSGPDAQKGETIHAALSGAYPANALPPDEHETYERCLSLLEVAVAEFKDRFAIQSPPTESLREERLWGRDEWLHKRWSGKPDVVLMWERHALIIDYKTGRDPVSTQGNLQLKALAVLVHEEFGCDIIGVKIVQPHCKQEELHVYFPSDFPAMSHEINELVRIAQEPDQALTPSEAACKYCKAKPKCPAALNVVMGLPAKVPKQSGEIMLGPKEIADVLNAAQIAEDVIKSVRSKAKRMLDSGIEIPGWKLKPGNNVEKIKDVPVLFNRFSAIGGTQEQFIGTVTVAKTKLKDAVRSVTGEKGKALDATIDFLLDGITESKQNAPSLVKEGE